MEHPKLGPRRPTPGQRGIALIVVLMIVVLTTILLLAFFLSVQTESKSVRSVISGQNSRQLADIATQSVIAQIQQATTQGNTIAWASQPGMIRTYDSFGNPAAWYKLYSSSSSVITSPTEALTLITGDLPATSSGTAGAWATAGSPNYGVFTDLNSPVISADGNLTYPIMNPTGATSIATTAGTNPILGFDIDTTKTPGYSSGPAVGPTNNQAAMPVRWIYILQNGAQVPAVASGTAGIVTVAGASSSNPIVGRIAYWTDDESCKLNVNTAADGTYYDTPRFNGPSAVQYSATETGAQRDIERLNDKQLALAPPFGAEYQRYIGHPAQTKLSYVFPTTPANSIGAQDLGTRSQVFSNISPFMQWGGSEGGAYTAIDNVPGLLPPQRQTPYASLDEWMFNTQLDSSNNRKLNLDLNGVAIVNNLAQPTSSQVNPSLQQLRFFLSANSEAPEVNLFGQPRIAIWPISSDYNAVTNKNSHYVTNEDKLVAQASSMMTPPSLGGTPVQVPYYFSRLNTAPSGSTLTGAQSQTFDYTKIARNQTVFGFLRTLANLPIPGYGPATQPTFYTKYGLPEMDQILTEIFDYIRSTNPCDSQLYGGGAGSATDYRYSRQSLRTSKVFGGGTDYVGGGQVVPITITGLGAYSTKGFGRFYSMNEITLDFTQSQFSYLPPVAPSTTCTVDSTHQILTALVHVGLYSPSLGPPNIIPDIRVEIAGLNNLTITTTPASPTATQSLFGPVNSANYSPARTTYSVIPEPTFSDLNNSYSWHDNPPTYNFQWGGSVGPRLLTLFHNYSYQDYPISGTTPGTGAATATLTGTYAPKAVTGGGNYMFCGIPIKVPTGAVMHCSGGQLTVKIGFTDLSTTGAGNAGIADPAFNTTNGEGFPGTTADTVQTYVVTFPAFDAPVPTNQSPTTTNPGPPVVVTARTVPSLGNRLFYSNYGPGDTDNSPIASITDDAGTHVDTTRSLIAGYNGDARLLAAQTGTITGEANPVTTDYATQPFVFLAPSAPTTTYNYHTQRDIFPNNNFRMHGCITAPSSIPTGLSLLNPANVTYGCPSVNGYVGDHTSTGTAAKSPDANGDWDNGLGIFPDGPYINRPDESIDQYQTYGSGTGSASYLATPPYYSGGSASIDATAVAYSSPNRAVASAVMFGSLPTGVPFPSTTPPVPATPWRTLLFRPQPTHFGATAPEDELLLDWFWMPVVTPYSISTTFATAGKVNMNYQIAPFNYITRATALMGVLSSEYVIAVPTTAGPSYKTSGTAPATPYRMPIRLLAGNGTTVTSNIDYTTGTLSQFKQRFDSGQIFKSACEICDIYLVPNPTPTAAAGVFNPTSTTTTGPAAYWSNNALTGDNSRERPYNGLYPRLTTKSNTYTVHVRAQTLTSPSNLPAGKWVENPALITSEYRGAVTINRYIDPQDPTIPDFANDAANTLSLDNPLDNYYKYRVLETRRFLP